MPRPQVVLVEDIAALQAGLPVLLPGFEFVAVYAQVEPLLVERPPADVVLLDLQLVNTEQPAARQGIAAVTAVRDAGYRVCLYTQEERRFVLAAAVAAGATGLVRKSAGMDEAAEVLSTVAAGGLVLPHGVVALADALSARGGLTVLSPRQRQVLNGRAKGQTYAEMAEYLHLSESTLRGYWQDILLTIQQHLAETAPAAVEHALGLAAGDLVNVWPERSSSGR